VDTLVVFGYGPVLPGDRLPPWATLNAHAAATWWHGSPRSSACRIVITGGRTGGAAAASEAALMAGVLRRLGVPAAALLLEEQATDTLYNLVHVTNLLDARGLATGAVTFLALRTHLRRIRAIADWIGLAGSVAAAEAILLGRSAKYRRVLEARLRPDDAAYRALLVANRRALRGMRELPLYGLVPLAHLASDVRLARAIAAPWLGAFWQAAGIDVTRDPIRAIRSWLLGQPRPFPEPAPEDDVELTDSGPPQ
jgi:hypothetical protein